MKGKKSNFHKQKFSCFPKINLGKKADAKMVGEETIQLILGIAVVILLIILVYMLIAPYFDKDKETAKSYLKTLEEEIGKAKQEGGGEFMMWQKEGETKFYVIYFGNKQTFTYETNKFISTGNNKNHICVCYIKDGETFCNACKNLDLPAIGYFSSEIGVDSHMAGVGDKLKITKDKDYYVFEKIN